MPSHQHISLLLDEIMAYLRRVLGAKLHGLYLYGSLFSEIDKAGLRVDAGLVAGK